MSNNLFITRITLQSILLLAGYSLFSQQILVSPYIQPGNASGLSNEEKVLIWQTDSVPGNFEVEYTNGAFVGAKKIMKAKVSSDKLFLRNKTTLLYRARFSKLQFDESYTYRINLNGKLIDEHSFASRTKGTTTRFAVFGDCGAGTPQQGQIALQVYQRSPQFVLVLGDIVYNSGLEIEYRNRFFPYYLSEQAPLMSSIPFYLVVGNHDTGSSDLDKFPDGLAFFYYGDLPLNAPAPKFTVEVSGEPQRVKDFMKNTRPRFPRMTNYSFDYGNVHIVCLDASNYINPLDPALVEWLKNDLKSSRADWKIVAHHNPGFNSSKTHYDDQLMRLLSPVFEEHEVDLVLAGHVHNYQRSMPLTFTPKKSEDGTQYIVSPEGRVDGTFKLDQEFDGITNTRPKGIVYVVSGGGGAALYDMELTDAPELWKHEPEDNWVPYTVKMVSDKHSFTLIETNGKELSLQQLDTKGEIIDEIKVTK